MQNYHTIEQPYTLMYTLASQALYYRNCSEVNFHGNEERKNIYIGESSFLESFRPLLFADKL